MCNDLRETYRICVMLLYDVGFLESSDSTLLVLLALHTSIQSIMSFIAARFRMEKST